MAARAPHRSLWWTVHHWAGLKLGLLLSFVLITGTIATVADEIDWMIQPAMRARAQPGTMASWGAWHAAAAGVPGFMVEEVLAPIEPGFAVRAKGEDADGEARLVHIDPWTARVQGVTSTVTVQDVVRDLHRALMLPTDIGIVLVTSLSVPLLLTLATAFKVYKKWWRGFFRWPRPMRHPREARRYIGDLHRLAGLWSLWFIALIGATGLWYLADRLGAGPPEPEGPAVAVAVASAVSPGIPAAAPPSAGAIDAMIARAIARWPGFAVRGIAVEDGRLTLQGQASALLVRDRANQAWFAVRDGRALGMHDATGMSAYQRMSEAADPLHFGNWGGLPSKLLWFAFGALLSSLSVTGTLICALRLAAPGERMRSVVRQMGIGAVASVVLIVLAIARLLQLGG